MFLIFSIKLLIKLIFKDNVTYKSTLKIYKKKVVLRSSKISCGKIKV